MNYYDYDKNLILQCSNCGWSGKAKDGAFDYYDQYMTIECPTCLDDVTSLLIVVYPTPEETKLAAKQGNQEAKDNLPVALYIEQKLNLSELAKKLVKERIKGFRKGTTDILSSTHSIKVAKILEGDECSWDVYIAGLLHDIVEDGDTSLKELEDFGFSKRTIELVDLCSHDKTIENNDARWVKMMARLSEVNDRDAWLIKLADLLDNIRGCHTMPADRQKFMRQTKSPLLLALTKEIFGYSIVWNTLQSESGNATD
jgi:(p)ppGpp synthase/HD superfamily hydrolase